MYRVHRVQIRTHLHGVRKEKPIYLLAKILDHLERLRVERNK